MYGGVVYTECEKEKEKARKMKEKREKLKEKKLSKDGAAHIDDLDSEDDDNGMPGVMSDVENESDMEEDNSNYKEKSKQKNAEMKEAERRKPLERACLQEIGPRFTMKMRYLQHGTFDAKNGEYEYMWRPDSQVSRKKMFL